MIFLIRTSGNQGLALYSETQVLETEMTFENPERLKHPFRKQFLL